MTEETDREAARVHKQDQALASVEDLAFSVAMFYNSLRAKGLPRQESLRLTVQFIITAGKTENG